MSKAAVRKLHWHSKVQDSFIPLVGSSGDLGVSVGGGADYGEFPFVTAAPGGGLTVGDVILEIGGTPVLGMTLGDVRGVLHSCLHPIRIKTVSPGAVRLISILSFHFIRSTVYVNSGDRLGCVTLCLSVVIDPSPGTTRLPRDGEISGLDYNFVSIEEFFSLEESAALLESGKFKGNYYGTPRPVHIGPESPPITYREHRNLLRNFRTRSKSLSNLEKAAEEEENSEEGQADQRCGRQGTRSGSAGISNAHPVSLSPCRSRGYGSAMENGHGSSSARVPAVMSKNWKKAFSNSGEPFYTDHYSKTTSWQDRRAQSSRETMLDKNQLPSGHDSSLPANCTKPLLLSLSVVSISLCASLHFSLLSVSFPTIFPSLLLVFSVPGFTDQPGELRGFSIHICLSKGPGGFGFNIVGGSRAREFLQVYSITPGGPGALNTADILVYINDICVLGTSHKEVVEMLKAVPVGHSVDMVLRRGYPMLYNTDGCLKQPHPGHSSGNLAHSTAPSSPFYRISSGHLSDSTAFDSPSYRRSSVHPTDSAEPPSYRRSRRHLSDSTSPTPPSYRRSSGSMTVTTPPVRPPRSLRGLAHLQAPDNSQSDSEVVSAIGSHRASMIRNHNNNSLSTPPQPLRYRTSKSDLSESDLLPMPQSGRPRLSSSPGGGVYSRLIRPQASLLRPPPTPDSPQIGFHSNTSGSGSHSSITSPGLMGLCSGGGVGGGGELVPVALAQCEGGGDMGFSVTAGGQGGRLALIKRVWDRRQCSSLQPGDAIMKINGVDVQSLSFAQIQRVLQEYTKQKEVILLVHRGGSHHSSISPNSIRKVPSPLLRPPPSPVASDKNLSPPAVVLFPPRPTSTPPPPPPAMMRSSLVQSTSFLESVPVTLTMEPKDWLNAGIEDERARGVVVPGPGQEGGGRNRVPRGFNVELRRKPGEGFGFVIASQDVEKGKGEN
ncbi:unnamed protein product [Oncorhynchus mykiss]|uniref:PDZ domain-containing protein n=1 Tax=Oncorhynchus mykiss TaxID=8022 RepID=A0A060YJM7_ONCMY|nr:unnamed protein product [Oncorhynchus mykiss]